jgi:hypothetical protein
LLHFFEFLGMIEHVYSTFIRKFFVYVHAIFVAMPSVRFWPCWSAARSSSEFYSGPARSTTRGHSGQLQRDQYLGGHDSQAPPTRPHPPNPYPSILGFPLLPPPLLTPVRS